MSRFGKKPEKEFYHAQRNHLKVIKTRKSKMTVGNDSIIGVKFIGLPTKTDQC